MTEVYIFKFNSIQDFLVENGFEPSCIEKVGNEYRIHVVKQLSETKLEKLKQFMLAFHFIYQGHKPSEIELPRKRRKLRVKEIEKGLRKVKRE